MQTRVVTRGEILTNANYYLTRTFSKSIGKDFISICSANIVDDKDTIDFDNMLLSWRSHVETVPMHISCSGKNVSSMLNKYNMDNSLNIFYNKTNLSQFEHFKVITDAVKDNYVNKWVLFSSMDGIWHKSRVLPYSKLLEKAMKQEDNHSYISLHISPGLVSPESNYSLSTVKYDTFESIDQGMSNKKIDNHGNPMEIESYCVRYSILKTFLNTASPSLLNSNLCGKAFIKFLTHHQNKSAQYLAPSAATWHYYIPIRASYATQRQSTSDPQFISLVNHITNVANQNMNDQIASNIIATMICAVEEYCAFFPTVDKAVDEAEACTYVKHTVDLETIAEPRASSLVSLVVKESIHHPALAPLIHSAKLDLITSEQETYPTTTF